MMERKDNFPAVVLSGGKSSRMGEAKALLPFDSRRLIDHVAARIRPQVGNILLNANDPDIALEGTKPFPDSFGGFQGPLAGIHAALAHVTDHLPQATHAFMLPIDCPFFPRDIVATLAATIIGPDDVALASSGNRMHPVLGLWPVSALADLTRWLGNPPTLKVRAFLDDRPLRITPYAHTDTSLGPLDPFFNINTREDLEHARTILEQVNP